MSSRNRHPSTAWRPNLERCRARLTEALTEEQVPWPELGAAVLTERGTSGMSLEEWARSIGVDAGVVASAEAGTLPFDAWPRRLQLAVPRRESWAEAACSWQGWRSAPVGAALLASEVREEAQPGSERGE